MMNSFEFIHHPSSSLSSSLSLLLLSSKFSSMSGDLENWQVCEEGLHLHHHLLHLFSYFLGVQAWEDLKISTKEATSKCLSWIQHFHGFIIELWLKEFTRVLFCGLILGFRFKRRFGLGISSWIPARQGNSCWLVPNKASILNYIDFNCYVIC